MFIYSSVSLNGLGFWKRPVICTLVLSLYFAIIIIQVHAFD